MRRGKPVITHKYTLSDNTTYLVEPNDTTHIEFVTSHAKKNKLALVNETTGEEIVKLKEKSDSDKK